MLFKNIWSSLIWRVETFIFSFGTGGRRSGTLSVFLRLSGSVGAFVRSKCKASKWYSAETVLYSLGLKCFKIFYFFFKVLKPNSSVVLWCSPSTWSLKLTSSSLKPHWFISCCPSQSSIILKYPLHTWSSKYCFLPYLTAAITLKKIAITYTWKFLMEEQFRVKS